MTLDLDNLSARRGFFDVHTPLSEQWRLEWSFDELKQYLDAVYQGLLTRRAYLHKKLGRPTANTVREVFKKRRSSVISQAMADEYVSVGLRLQEVARMFTELNQERHAYGERPCEKCGHRISAANWCFADDCKYKPTT